MVMGLLLAAKNEGEQDRGAFYFSCGKYGRS